MDDWDTAKSNLEDICDDDLKMYAFFELGRMWGKGKEAPKVSWDDHNMRIRFDFPDGLVLFLCILDNTLIYTFESKGVLEW